MDPILASPPTTPLERCVPPRSLLPAMEDSAGWQSILRQNYANHSSHSSPMVQRLQEMHGAELRGEEEQVAAQRSPSPEPEDLQEDADEETKKFAEYLGMNGDDRHLMWIAESAVRAPLPSGWTQVASRPRHAATSRTP